MRLSFGVADIYGYAFAVRDHAYGDVITRLTVNHRVILHNTGVLIKEGEVIDLFDILFLLVHIFY